MKSILIVDDEKNTRDGLIATLSESYDVASAGSADDAIRMMNAQNFDLILTDLRMTGKSGYSVIDYAIRHPNKPASIMMTAYGNIDVAVEAMKHGASDFITKPLDISKLEVIIAKAIRKRDELIALEKIEDKKIVEPATKSTIKNHKIIASGDAMREVLSQVTKVAKTKATIMITGETGTGKELVAQLIHSESPRKTNPFVAVHCAAIPSNLLESELFGYEKGAFTGAIQKTIGKFESADTGTLFLDEIGEIDHPTQVKLLRFLETRSFEKLGSTKTISVDVRLICATNKDLKQMVDEGNFREDLFYRLNVIEINLPPLRDRKDEIDGLLDYYLKFYSDEEKLICPTLSKEARKILHEYPWLGNIRELRNFCEKAVVFSTGKEIEKSDLEPKFFITNIAKESINLDKNMNEKELIKKALAESKGNKTKAAELLGVSRRTLHRKLK